MSDTGPKTQYYTAATLDGFIAGPDHSLDWLFQFGAEGTPDYPDFIRRVGAVAMGSSTYEWVLRHRSQLVRSEVYGPFVQLRYAARRCP